MIYNTCQTTAIDDDDSSRSCPVSMSMFDCDKLSITMELHLLDRLSSNVMAVAFVDGRDGVRLDLRRLPPCPFFDEPDDNRFLQRCMLVPTTIKTMAA